MTQLPEHTCWRSKPATIAIQNHSVLVKDRNSKPEAADPATEAQCPACVFLKYEVRIRVLERAIEEKDREFSNLYETEIQDYQELQAAEAQVQELEALIREVLAAEQVYPGKVSWMDMGQIIDDSGWFGRAKEALNDGR
jgi:hypothetical protein